jgi:hypothetical protein
MPNKNQSCTNCYFFLQTSARGIQKIGYCRANPPQLHNTTNSEGKEIAGIGRFPVVLSNMWCGAFDYSDAIEEVGGVSE